MASHLAKGLWWWERTQWNKCILKEAGFTSVLLSLDFLWYILVYQIHNITFWDHIVIANNLHFKISCPFNKNVMNGKQSFIVWMESNITLLNQLSIVSIKGSELFFFRRLATQDEDYGLWRRGVWLPKKNDVISGITWKWYCGGMMVYYLPKILWFDPSNLFVACVEHSDRGV